MESLSRDSLRATQNQYPVLSQVVKWLKTGVWPPRGDVDGGGTNCYRTGHSGEGCFWRTVCCKEVGNMKRQAKICIIKSAYLRVSCYKFCAPWTTILRQATLACRRLQKKSVEVLLASTREDFENHIRRCGPWAEVNDPFKQFKAPLVNINAGHPLQLRVAIDIVGHTPRSTSVHEWLLLVSDHFTKFAQAFR